MKKKSAQIRRNQAKEKGLAKPLVIIGVVIVGLIVFFAATGSFKFEASVGNNKNQQVTPETTETETESATGKSDTSVSSNVVWETFKSDQYGYTVRIPEGWKVTDNPSENSREITVMHPGAQAIVLITALNDEGLKDTAYMKSSMQDFKEKLENDPQTLQVAKFQDKIEGNTGGFIAVGEEKRSGVNWYFEQRGLLNTSGRILLFHGAAQSNVYKQYKDIISEIIESFTIEG